MQGDEILAMHHGFQFLDAAHIHDQGAVDAEKGVRIKRFFQGGQRHVEEMFRFTGVEEDVVFGGFNPIDVPNVDENGLAGGPHSQTL